MSIFSRRILLSFLVLLLQPLAYAHADTLTVGDGGDDGKPNQLRALIDQAKDGDVIMIPAGMTVKIAKDGVEDQNASGDFDLNKNLTIQGAGAQVSIIEGDDQSRIFDIAEGKSVAISQVSLRGGNSTEGGAIRNKGGLILDKVHVDGNTAVQGNANGGGLFQAKGTTVIFGSSFTNNVSKNGGAIYLGAGTVELRNSTLGKNTATDLGGGVITISGSTFRSNYSTFSENSAAEGGGFWGGGSFQNTILFKNIGTKGLADLRAIGTVSSLGHNLVGAVNDGIFNQAGDITGKDAMLEPLAENEPLPFFALQNQSPALDAADDSNCFPKDIRDTLRPQGAHCDIGSFEWQAASAGSGNPTGNNSGNGNGAPVDVNTQDSSGSGGGCQMAKGGPANSPVSSALMMTGMFSMLIFWRLRKKEIR